MTRKRDCREPCPARPLLAVTRRGLLAGGGALAAGAALPRPGAAQSALPGAGGAETPAPFPAARSAPLGRPYNVILFITDEESYHLRPAEGYALPARAELTARGTTFHSHYIAAAMCTPSRGVMFSGQPPQVNGLFDQMELGYVPSLRTDQPSLGTIFKQLGYATAYFGKFELRRDIVNAMPGVNYSDALREYGFDIFAPDGDKPGGPSQGYDTDGYSAAAAVRWLRTEAQRLNEAGTPWLLVVSFVNPHDVMYADANQPGQQQQVSQVGMTLTPPPPSALYEKQWDFEPSASWSEPMDSPGRPRAHLSYMVGWSAFLGEIPVGAAAMWRTYYNFYLNLIRDNDRSLQSVLDAVSELGLWDSTIVMRTADHGELAGAHGGLRGKGPLPYEEEAHVPAVIVHPEHPGGRSCQALTSHIDLLPTLAALGGAETRRRALLLEGLPGRDFSPLLQDPETAAADAIREAVLFNYVGLQTVDSLYMIRVCTTLARGEPAPSFFEAKPDLSRRGFICFVFDGRYKYARYYAPDDFNTPESFEEILARNDLELFDLQEDPDEIANLGADSQANKALILRLNALMNRMIAREVGGNDGRFLPPALRQG